ncbi:mannitol-1-phosphate 5-dehydrogenase [Mycoplasma cottewii]|uniref:Mannitol-1-phosphate 5-dehydrogenase n=1 Tax=Mycoplasma cottewii TaxID=51364 RepID=A0ABY5TX53_9MOLU|nr:mannitol-1-phosphate 5-dehydrogenase [Mycoplasma cottewii]UWD35254.1 mannitol-1-phosphate 5-dehydrogenase [Mycoplasma cottewii]
MKLIHFGAGNIGKCLVGCVLSQQVDLIYFVDNNKKVVDQLNNQKVIKIKTSEQKQYIINNFKSYLLSDFLKYKNTWDEINLITISIGVNNLDHIKDYIQKIIDYKSANQQQLIIMCCENKIRVSSWFKTKFNNLTSNIYFVDVLVDRIIPIQNNNSDFLECEDYYLWAVDNKQWPKEINKLKDLKYVDDFDNQIDKKIYMLNAIHCSISWYVFKNIGYQKCKTVYQAMQIKQVVDFVNDFLDEVIMVLNHKLNIELKNLIDYKKEIINRLNNKFIDDDLKRLARNSQLKLSENERILFSLNYAKTNNLKYKTIQLSYENGLEYLKEND